MLSVAWANEERCWVWLGEVVVVARDWSKTMKGRVQDDDRTKSEALTDDERTSPSAVLDKG